MARAVRRRGARTAARRPAPRARAARRHLRKLNEGPRSPFAFLGNEPELVVPWLYDWLGAPEKTARAVRAARALFDASPGGYPGNDDLGALSAWYVFAALGFYPAVPGTGILALASPVFPFAHVLAGGRDVVITTGRHAARDAVAVAKLEVNRRRHDRPWLQVDSILCGGSLRFHLTTSRRPGWGSAPGDAPPSFPPRTPFPKHRPPLRCREG